jgi:hypothetical protein
MAHLSAKTLHICAGGYLAMRTVYNLAYVFIDDGMSFSLTALFGAIRITHRERQTQC